MFRYGYVVRPPGSAPEPRTAVSQEPPLDPSRGFGRTASEVAALLAGVPPDLPVHLLDCYSSANPDWRDEYGPPFGLSVLVSDDNVTLVHEDAVEAANRFLWPVVASLLARGIVSVEEHAQLTEDVQQHEFEARVSRVLSLAGLSQQERALLERAIPLLALRHDV